MRRSDGAAWTTRGLRNTRDLLNGLNLVHDGRLLNAAAVLFAKANRLLPNYPQCLLKMARFRGRDKTRFLDNRQEHGNAFDLLIRGQRFLRDHLPIAGRVVSGLFERIDDPLYPPRRCVRRWPTPCATGTMRRAAGPSAWPFTTTGWKSPAPARYRSDRRRKT